MNETYKATDIGLIPESWELVPIYELRNKADRYSFTGGPFGSDLKSEDYTDSGVRVIQLQNIGEGVFINKGFIYTSLQKADQLKSCNIYPNEIILAKMAPVARCCKVPSFEDKFLMSSDGIRLAVDERRFDKEFIFQALNSNYFRKKAESLSTGTTRARIGLNELRTIELAIPPSKYEQRKIGTILSTVDKKIEAILAKITEFEKLKQSLTQLLLKRGIGNTSFRKTELGDIPENWQIKKINEISNVVRGSSPRPAGDPLLFNGSFLPWITVAEITNNRSKYLTSTKTYLTKLGSFQTRILQPDTVLLSNSGATLGVPAILKIEAGANDGVAAFLKLREVTELYLFYYLQSLTDYFRNQLAPGSGQPNLNTTLIGNVLIAVPPIEEQEKITAILFLVDEKISVLKEKQQAYQIIKNGLMQQLLTGKIRVNEHQQQSAVA